MNRHHRRAAARQEFRAGVQAMAAEANGMVKITTIRPEDFVCMVADALAGHGEHADLLETVADLVARVTRARSTPHPMLCAACPAELTGGYAVVIATGAGPIPSRGLGMGVCTACGCDLPSIEAAALKGLQAIWPDLRPITIHPHEGHA